MVIWIIGLSGSGKTYLAKKIFKDLEKKNKKCFLVDGDVVRKYISYNLGYSIRDRKVNSKIIADLCKFLEINGYIVICSVLSIFPSHQKNNRKKFKKYIQIYLESDLNKLIKINSKKIYSQKSVVGKDIKFPTPYKSHFILNRSDSKKYKYYYSKILDKIGK
jgi:adenylylsulfate kinase